MTDHGVVPRNDVGTMKIAGPDGVTTTFHDFGGRGPVLLFAHATGMHGLMWKPVVEHLLDRARCVAVDLRGHGDSSLPPGFDLSWQGFGVDVLAVVHALGGADVIGVGHSLGGAALLMAELEAPGSFQRLFLYEPAVHPDTEAEDRGLMSALADAMVDISSRRRAAFPSRAEALAHYVTKPPMAQFQAAVLGAYVSHGFVDRTDGAEHWVALKCQSDTEARIYAGYRDQDVAERLHAITCPVTLATGAETDPVQRGMIRALGAQFGSPPVVLPGVDHFAPMQQPKQFADAVALHVLNV